MTTNHFNEDYVTYWKQRVGNSTDGSKVAGEDIAGFYIGMMGISPTDKVLDLGCGHGRLFPVLANYSQNVAGIDVTFEAINAAAQYPYSVLVKGTAETTNFAEKSFNSVIAWGVFDVVDQETGFLEANRILKDEGLFLVTGKNADYAEDDALAFVAERNAKLKDFPNHFTDVALLIDNLEKFGFEVLHSFAFHKRGDFGENKFVLLNTTGADFKFYEFALVLKKISDAVPSGFKFCSEFSKTATARAEQNNFQNPIEFFKWHKQHDEQ